MGGSIESNELAGHSSFPHAPGGRQPDGNRGRRGGSACIAPGGCARTLPEERCHATPRLTLDTPAENIALDEALLDEAEARGPDAEFLRIWESPTPLVVLGRSSRVAEEVDLAACAERGIPILRRSSGGAAIVAGPGCLMYAVVLSYDRRPEARGIHASHGYVLDRLVAALRQHVPAVARAGTSDLVLADERRRQHGPQVLRQQPAREADALPLSRHAALRLRFVARSRVACGRRRGSRVSAAARAWRLRCQSAACA